MVYALHHKIMFMQRTAHLFLKKAFDCTMHLMIQSLKVECFRFADLVSGQQYAMWVLGVLMQPHQHADL